MGLMDELKQEIKNTGTSKGKFLYTKDGSKIRVRFLQEIDDGYKIPWHDSYALGVDVPCQEVFGRECKHCGDDDLRTRNKYAWSVYDYESEEVKIFMYPVNNCTPIPQLISFAETYGTITDRDYEIKQQGKGQNKTFSVVPLEVRKFRNTKAKPLSKSALLKYIDKAYPDKDADDDEEETPKQNRKKGNKTEQKKETKKKYMNEPEEDEEDEDEEEKDYEEMTARELFKLCRERDIDCRPKKDKDYYIELLEEYDDEQDDDWDEDEDDDEDSEDSEE